MRQQKELWIDCYEWLISAGVLEADTKFYKPADFAVILRDGILLCVLTMKLHPGCIDKQEIFLQYQQSPASSYLNGLIIVLIYGFTINILVYLFEKHRTFLKYLPKAFWNI